MDKGKIIERLNSKSAKQRLAALKELKAITPEREKGKGYTNNHVHTKYSFSPYSPTRAIYEAYMSGLATVGIMDHDSMAGAKEFVEAGEIMGIVTTVGFEIRTDWSDTPFSGKKINNPDQLNCGYICVHGVPHQSIDAVEEYLSKIRLARNERNKRMVLNINSHLDDITLDFEKDVIPISYADDGGVITERHILYVLALKLLKHFGRGEKLSHYISNDLGIAFTEQQKQRLMDTEYEYYDYDVLNILKSGFITKIYETAVFPELPPVGDLLRFCQKQGAIVAYPYLGDVDDSPTGDKKTQKFEDEYLDELFSYVDSLGFDAIAYMPSRNTKAQLIRIIKLCEKHDFFQISGEDINQPRQSFINKELLNAEYIHLIDSTWALVGHENLASHDITKGMFFSENKSKKLCEKLPIYAKHGHKYEK